MGRRDDEDHYREDPFLTRGQQLAQESAMGNPFLHSDSGFGPLSEPSLRNAAAYEEAAKSIPNALIEPPVEINRMPVAQQMLWQEYQERGLKEQVARDKELLALEVNRKADERDARRTKQGLELVRRTSELNPSDVQNYPLARAALVRELVEGSTDPDAKASLDALDAVYNAAKGIADEERKAKDTFNQTVNQNLFTRAAEAAEKEGPAVHAQFIQRAKVNPDDAIAFANATAAKSRQANIEQQLLAGGETREAIKNKFVSPEGEFLFGAAEAEAKGGGAYRKEIAALFSRLSSARQKWKTDIVAQAKALPFEEEAEYQNAKAEFNRVLGQPPGEQAGVRNMPGAVEGQSLYKGYQQPVVQPVVPPAATQSAAPANRAEAAAQAAIKTYYNEKTGKRLYWDNQTKSYLPIK